MRKYLIFLLIIIPNVVSAKTQSGSTKIVVKYVFAEKHSTFSVQKNPKATILTFQQNNKPEKQSNLLKKDYEDIARQFKIPHKDEEYKCPRAYMEVKTFDKNNQLLETSTLCHQNQGKLNRQWVEGVKLLTMMLKLR